MLFWKKFHVGAVIPTKGTQNSAGWDLTACEDIVIEPFGKAFVRTGIAVALPEGHYGRIALRSSTARDYSVVVNAGCIDNDYRGEIIVILVSYSPSTIVIPRVMTNGYVKSFAQLIVEKYYDGQAMVLDTLPEPPTTHLGFGSTDKIYKTK